MRYEYNTFYSPSPNQATHELNKLGSQGWVLTSVFHGWYYLKRQVSEPSAAIEKLSDPPKKVAVAKAEKPTHAVKKAAAKKTAVKRKVKK